MSIGRKIVALIIAPAFVAIGIAFMIWRIGSVIGWDNVAGGWWVIVLISGLILFIAFLVYVTVRSKLGG